MTPQTYLPRPPGRAANFDETEKPAGEATQVPCHPLRVVTQQAGSAGQRLVKPKKYQGGRAPTLVLAGQIRFIG
ncbi:hypothetical protein ACAW74_00475 [Fibrella sp. WM1]|uniref:hypothetical protein n=1 Tax=Fibrella musci TaxID=3242485 RepID=UPI0035230CA6